MLIRLYKIGVFFRKYKMYYLSRIIFKIQFFLYNTVLPHETTLGQNTRFAYGGIGCVVHARTVLGDNCVIGQGCTIGGRSKHYDVPKIGNNVYLGAGSRILGPIEIGDSVIVAPNSVVIESIPSNCIVVGIPGKVIKTGIEPQDYI